MALYPLVKEAHMTLAAVSVIGLMVRSALGLRATGLPHGLLMDVAPHVIDTLLLASGITLAVMIGASPTENPWLTVKLGAVVVYIVLGSLAVKRLRSRVARGAALFSALLVIVYIVAVAFSKTPIPW